MDPVTQEKIQEAMEILDRGDTVYVTRYIAGELRQRYRQRKGETRRVYVVREFDQSDDGGLLHYELRQKGT